MDERQRRIGRNEALFREVNERIERASESFQATTERIAILCECGDESCADKIDVSLSEYERIRQDPTLFFVLPGHGNPEVEDIVEEHDGYDIVRKRAGPPADLARKLDSREN